MRFAGRFCLAALTLAAGLCSSAQGAYETFDGPIATGPSQAPNTWYTDRYAPAGFDSGETAPDGRTGTLRHSIDHNDFNRPAPFNSAFYTTQGRKLDLPVGTTELSIELFVSSDWDALDQTAVPGSAGRLASFWATGFDAGGVSTGMFPIIEFNSAIDDFRVWNSNTGTWSALDVFAGYDQWYTLGMTIDGGNENYYVNGVLVATVADPLTTQFGNVILQGYNADPVRDYDIHWDNLDTHVAPVPEPSTLALFGLGGLGLIGGAIRRRFKRAG